MPTTTASLGERRAKAWSDADEALGSVSQLFSEMGLHDAGIPFGTLPKDVRLIVWEFIARQPRLLEIEPLGKKHDPSTFHGSLPRFSRSARRVPGILRVNREARAIALGEYKLVSCPGFETSKLYYHPTVDVMVFGSRCCIMDMIKFFHYTAVEETLKETGCPRIAFFIDLPRKSFHCCGTRYGLHGAGSSVVELAFHVLHGLDLLRTQDGVTIMMPLEMVLTTPWLGCKGLREIFMIGHVSAEASGNPSRKNEEVVIDETICLAYNSDRMIDIHEINRHSLVFVIDRIGSAEGILGVGANRWVGDDKPTIRYTKMCKTQVSNLPQPTGALDLTALDQEALDYWDLSSWRSELEFVAGNGDI